MSAAPENSAASATARMVDPWKSKAYDREFEWLVKNMVPREVRPCFKTLLADSQMSVLTRMDADAYGHNETLLSYLPTHARESYDILVSHLAEQKGDEFARRAGRLRAAVLPASHTVLGDTRHDTKPHLPEAEQSAPAAPTPAAPAPTAGAAPPAQRTDPVPAWSSRPIADMNNKKIVGGKLAGYLVNQEKDTVAREVVRLIDEVQADTAATILIDYCRDNPEVIVSAGHYNMTGLLYYIGEHKSEMTCQEFVDFVGKHVPGKKRRVELAFDKAEFIKSLGGTP